MASKITLYWGSGSIPCWKPMIVLAEKNIDYNSKLLSFSKKEHKGEDITSRNPRGQLPTFEDGDVVICESGAICDYLEFKYGDKGNRLLPTDPAQRAKVLQRVHEAQNLQRHVIEEVVYYQFRTKPEDFDIPYLDGKKKDAREELKRWDKYLADQGESYIAGKEFTMADVFVYPFLAFGVRSELNIGQFPHLEKYYKRLSERASIKATMPPHWSEEPGKGFMKGVCRNWMEEGTGGDCAHSGCLTLL